jgi:S-(hydroxymethyl)glutathione dehydrogenase/alcohol dehydrogenase
MRAAILEAQRRPLIVDDVELPPELGHGQVLVDVAYSGICGSQLGEINGVKGEDRFLPHLLGHEGGGVVAEVGPGVTTVAPGQRVVMHWMPGAGRQSDPPVYRWHGATLNAGWVTTFNERAVVSENRVTPIPDDLPLDVATLFGCALTTGFGVVVNDAGVKIGESVVVLGAGGVGLSVVQGAHLSCAHPIVAVDLHDAKLELARRLGATHTINASQVDAPAAIRDIVGPRGADVVIENTGVPELIERAFELAGPRGRTILVGVPPHGERARLYTLPLHFGKVLTGSHGGGAAPDRDIPRYLSLVRAGRLELGQLITARYRLEDINDAIEDLRAGRIAGRCVVEIAPNDSDAPYAA